MNLGNSWPYPSRQIFPWLVVALVEVGIGTRASSSTSSNPSCAVPDEGTGGGLLRTAVHAARLVIKGQDSLRHWLLRLSRALRAIRRVVSVQESLYTQLLPISGHIYRVVGMIPILVEDNNAWVKERTSKTPYIHTIYSFIIKMLYGNLSFGPLYP